MISLESVHRTFGDVSVLEGVDLEVAAGEFVALVGPNGAGKTTLLRTVNGVLEPDEGTVRLAGTPTRDLTAKEVSRMVATVPQNTSVEFAFTAEHVVEMGRTPHRSRLDWSHDLDPVDRALERTETSHLRDRQVDELSGGERQRVLLARALAQEAPALLLDEPTASLDINHQVRILRLVADLVEEGLAAVAAIHDIDLAARFCDRLVLLHEGNIVASGDPAVVMDDTRFGEAFGTTAAVTENRVTGTPTIAAVDRTPREERVHLFAHGDEGVRLLRTLWRAGFDVTVGPVPSGDVTAQLAAELGLAAVTAPAFEPPSDDVFADARDLAGAADVVVRTDGSVVPPAQDLDHGRPQVTVLEDGEAGDRDGTVIERDTLLVPTVLDCLAASDTTVTGRADAD